MQVEDDENSFFLFRFVACCWMVLSSFTAPALVAVEHNNKKKKVIQLYDFGAAAGSGPAEYIHISTKMKGGLEAITTPPPSAVVVAGTKVVNGPGRIPTRSNPKNHYRHQLARRFSRRVP